MKDTILRKSFYDRHCEVCGTTPCDPCHIKTYGSGGPDAESNIIPMCRIHHIEQGQLGWQTFAQKYPQIWGTLTDKGWFLDCHGKLKRA